MASSLWELQLLKQHANPDVARSEWPASDSSFDWSLRVMTQTSFIVKLWHAA
jgi:hypothetical protein